MLVGLVVVVVLTRILVGLWHSAEALQWMAKVREMEVELDKAGKTHDASLSSVQEELHKHKRHTFSKVLWIVPLHSKCTRALTFENFCQGSLLSDLARNISAGLAYDQQRGGAGGEGIGGGGGGPEIDSGRKQEDIFGGESSAPPPRR